VELSNPTDKTITVSDLHPSCGCLQAEMTKGTIEPGKTETIKLKITPLPGTKKETLSLWLKTDEYKDDGSRMNRVQVHIKVYEDIQVEPDVLSFGWIGKNEEKTLETTVTSYDGQPFKINTVATSHPEFKFKWEPIPGKNAYKIVATLQSSKTGMVAESAA